MTLDQVHPWVCAFSVSHSSSSINLCTTKEIILNPCAKVSNTEWFGEMDQAGSATNFGIVEHRHARKQKHLGFSFNQDFQKHWLLRSYGYLQRLNILAPIQVRASAMPPSLTFAHKTITKQKRILELFFTIILTEGEDLIWRSHVGGLRVCWAGLNAHQAITKRCGKDAMLGVWQVKL